MNLNDVQFGLTVENLGVLVFPGLTKPTEKIKDFITECFIKDEFKYVATNLGLGIVCPDLKQQMHLYFEAGEYWKRTIRRLDSPVEVLEWMK